MTVVFWSLVLSAVFLASRFGARWREKLLEAVSGQLARMIFAQKRPAAIWQVGSDLPAPIRSAARDQAAVHIVDQAQGTAIGGAEKADQADMVLADGRQSPAAENRYSDRDALIEALKRRLAQTQTG
jgi:hypothetical protein